MKKLYREEKENRVEYEGVRRIRSSPKKRRRVEGTCKASEEMKGCIEKIEKWKAF